MKKWSMLFIIMLFACNEKIISVPVKHGSKLSAGDHKVYGYYSLPMTILKVRVPVTIDSVFIGMLTKADTCMLRYIYDNFGWRRETKSKVEFKIDSKIIFEPLTLPDPSKRYAILYNDAKALNLLMNINISRDGLIQSGKFAQESRAFEIATKATELGGRFLGSIFGLGESKSKTKKVSCDLSTQKNLRAVKLIEHAEELASARYALIKEAGPSGVNATTVMEFQRDEIDKQLQLIQDELMGGNKKKTINLTFYLDPKADAKGDVLKRELVKINPAKGIVSNGSDDFKNISRTTKETDKTKVLEISFRKLHNSAIFAPPGPKKDGKVADTAFLFYNVPAKYEVSLTYGGKPIMSYASKDQKEGTDDYQIYFPQLGSIASIPADDFKEAEVTYYEDIGALQSAKFVRDGKASAANVESFFNAADTTFRTGRAIRAKSKAKDKPEAPVEDTVEEQVIRLIIENAPVN